MFEITQLLYSDNYLLIIIHIIIKIHIFKDTYMATLEISCHSFFFM